MGARKLGGVSVLALLASICVPGKAQAQIATDGSAGAAVSIGGPNYSIPSALGTISGTNLFHSFSTFNIGAGEVATFSGSGGLDNVIARVTGGSASIINGGLVSTIPGADFYFINPAGVMFGATASVNVPAGFHVSTADRLRFTNGDVMLSLGGSTFSVSTPASFGFLGANAGTITFNGTNLALSNTIDVSAANIVNTNALIQTNGGFLRLVAAGNGVVDAPVGGAAPTGNLAGDVTVTGANAIVRMLSHPIANAPTRVVSIYADHVVLDDGLFGADSHQGTPAHFLIQADTFTARNHAELILRPGIGVADLLFEINANTVSLTDSEFRSFTNGTNGEAGDLIIRAGALDLTNSLLTSSTNGEQDSGDIQLFAGNLTMMNSHVFTFTTGPGDAGDISLTIGSSLHIADSEFIANAIGPLTPETPVPIAHGRGGNIIFSGPSAAMTFVNSEVLSQTGSWDPGSAAGDININARTLTLQTSQILTSSGHRDIWGIGGAAPAGDIVINADEMTVLGATLISAVTLGNAPGGDVTINARTLDFFGDPLGLSRIDSLTGGNGPGGNVTLNIGERLHLQFAGISVAAVGPSDAGDLVVNAPNALIIVEGFRTANGTPSGLSATSGIPPGGVAAPVGTVFSGHGGNVDIIADRIVLRDTGFIGTSGFGADGASAGDVHITANNIDMFSAASIQSASVSGDAGSITIEMPSTGVLRMREALISTSNEAVGGSGGQISISRPAAIILEGGAFTLPTGAHVTGIEALGEIEGANINIASDYFIRSAEQPSRVAVNGTLVLDTLSGDPVAGAAALDAGFLNAGDVLANQCAAQRSGSRSALGLPDMSAPPELAPSPLSAPAFYTAANAAGERLALGAPATCSAGADLASAARW